MKNNQAMNLSELAATGSRLDLAIAAAREEVKLTILPAGKPQQRQLVYTSGRVRSAGSNYARKVG